MRCFIALVLFIGALGCSDTHAPALGAGGAAGTDAGRGHRGMVDRDAI